MRTKLLVIALAASFPFILQSRAQTADSGFPKGELSNAKNHTGNIWLSELNAGDATFDPGIAMATYDAGAKPKSQARMVSEIGALPRFGGQLHHVQPRLPGIRDCAGRAIGVEFED